MSDPAQRLAKALEGRYTVGRELGRGGMATVYLAQDLKHDRRVAIKVLRAELGEVMGEQRFAREIDIAAKLTHPNILALHDSGTADGQLYFVMPYLEGESLRDRLRRDGTLSLVEASRVIREVGSALSYAHGHDVVHRDIKPGNILFQAGHAIVCDFGIAKAISDARDRLTQTGLAVGTFAYMSPEQTTDDAVIDGRSDIYSLGCLLYEMLAGASPFQDSSPQAVLARKLVGAVPSVTEAGADIPVTVQHVLERSLATDPDRRYATVGDFAAALDEAQTTAAIATHARRRRRVRAAGLGGTAVGLGLFGLLGWWLSISLGGPAFERVAVLPFTNRTNDPGQTFFVEGIHEDLVLEMQRAGVRVINPSSVRRYADSDASLRDIAEELGVDAVIQGSVGLSDRRVGLEILLVDPVTSELVWTEPFSRAEGDVLVMLRDATLSITAELGVELTAGAEERLAAAGAVDPLVYEALLQARFEARSLTADGLDRAENYYRLALARDSLAVEAWTGLVGVWNVRAQQGLISQQQAGDNTGPLLARAGAIDPDMAQDFARTALRLTWPEWPAGRWAEAEAAFRQGLARDPGDAVLRAYFALLLLYLGRDEEAEDQTERAAEQAPDDVLVQGLHGQALNALHRWEDAEAALIRARSFVPDAPILLSTLRTIYHLLGRHELAIQMWRDSYQATGDDEALDALNRGFATGGYEAALASVAALMVERSRTQRVTPWQIGTLYTRAGMPDEALDYLETAVEEGDPNSPYLSTDAIFDDLRSEPRYRALIAKLGLPRPSS
jgi:eukaryotic-like serine/threonine-protein kinase